MTGRRIEPRRHTVPALRHGFTLSDPDSAGEVLGIDRGQWKRVAEDVIATSSDAADKPVPKDARIRHQVDVTGDGPWQQVLRLRQSLWREMKQYPIGTSDRGTQFGNYIDADYAKSTWCNFLSPASKSAAQEALSQPVGKGLITESRMLTNMLSSQPLCFNFFADLGADLELASAWGQRMWPRRVHRITDIRYEYSPGRGDPRYLDNLSAFDVFLEYENRSGEAGFIGIEVKYHEGLKDEPNEVRDRALEVAEVSNVFLDPNAETLTTAPLSQFYLDHLLALSMLQADDRWSDGLFVLLYPEANAACHEAVDQYLPHLTSTDTFQAVTMEEALICLPPDSDKDTTWATDFASRYLRT